MTDIKKVRKNLVLETALHALRIAATDAYTVEVIHTQMRESISREEWISNRILYWIDEATKQQKGV